MESNNSSSNTATASSSDPPPPNQRNDDKGKQTCSNGSEANKNKNNNPESSVLKAGNKRKSSSYYDGFVYMDDNDDLQSLPDGFFENGSPWNNDQCYSEPLILMENLVSGNDDPLHDFKGLDSTEDIQMSFAYDEVEPPQSSGGSSSQQLYHDYHLIKAGNQTVANSEGLFGYSEPLKKKPLIVFQKKKKKGLDSTEDIQMNYAYDKEEPPQSSGGSSSQQLYHDYHPIKAANQTVANSEGLFGYSEPLMKKTLIVFQENKKKEPALMEHFVSGNDSLNGFEDINSKEDVEMNFADEDPVGGSSPQQLYHDYHPF